MHLEPRQLGNFSVLEGRETTPTARPFYVLPGWADKRVIAEALRAAEEQITLGEHLDEADWLPAYELYIVEKSAPVEGAAPRALHAAVEHLDRLVMPFVREAYGCTTCVVCTAFVRRFVPSERKGVPTHFDVTSFSTIVLPLSSPENYTGGFYVQPGAHVETRQFVPLELGDVTVYDFTLNHGVDVMSGGRYALALWVSETWPACQGSQTPWHAQRAVEGDVVAQHILGMMFGQGNGAPQDDVRALEWTLRAAQGGLANAQFSAGTMYFEGRGSERNLSRSFYWYERAAAQGDASAQMLVARMLSEGMGTERDVRMAEHWYRLGSEQQGVSLMGPPSW